MRALQPSRALLLPQLQLCPTSDEGTASLTFSTTVSFPQPMLLATLLSATISFSRPASLTTPFSRTAMTTFTSTMSSPISNPNLFFSNDARPQMRARFCVRILTRHPTTMSTIQSNTFMPPTSRARHQMRALLYQWRLARNPTQRQLHLARHQMRAPLYNLMYLLSPIQTQIQCPTPDEGTVTLTFVFINAYSHPAPSPTTSTRMPDVSDEGTDALLYTDLASETTTLSMSTAKCPISDEGTTVCTLSFLTPPYSRHDENSSRTERKYARPSDEGTSTLVFTPTNASEYPHPTASFLIPSDTPSTRGKKTVFPR